jgi:NAD(P)-dependent dehydrogenase (short-subunit alcohol dehydrogenase family)
VRTIHFRMYSIKPFCQIYAYGFEALARQLFAGNPSAKFRVEAGALAGRVAIVTGASSGIGLETACWLASLGAQVVAGCKEDCAGVLQRLKDRVPTGKFASLELDLRRTTSILEFVRAFKKLGLPLDYLINNAAVMLAPFHLCNEDGPRALRFEEHHMVNYLGPFLLTHLLLPLLAAAGTAQQPSRVVCLSSVVHYCGSLEYDAWTPSATLYSAHAAYAASKLHVAMFAAHLAKLLTHFRVPVAIAAVHPGVVATRLYRHVSAVLQPLQTLLASSCFRTPRNGAATILHAIAAVPAAEVHGKYWSDCQVSVR